VLDRFTPPNLRKHVVFFALPVGRHDHANRLPDGFRGGVPEHAFGCPVPRADDPVEILADNRVVRRFDDAREMSEIDAVGRFRHAVTQTNV
jgi:hypothetical protein